MATNKAPIFVDGEPRALASLGCRFPALDLLRIVAILLVISSHTLPGHMEQRLWKDFPGNVSIGAFFVLSGVLLLPISESVGDFLRKRLKRVFIPLAIWSIVYAIVYYAQGERDMLVTAKSFRDILFHAIFPTGWFCYAIGGIYLFAPVISPWLRKASRRQLEGYLMVWLLSLNMPFFRVFTDISAGLFALFYNCLGYGVMGIYLIYYGIPKPPSWRLWCPALLLLTVYPLFTRIHNGWTAYSDAFYITPNCTEAFFGILMFILFWQMFGGWKQAYRTPTKSGRVFDKLLRELSIDSFGVYLIHWIFIFHILYPCIPGWGPSWATYFLTIAVCFPAAALLRRIPVIGKYLM